MLRKNKKITLYLKALLLSGLFFSMAVSFFSADSALAETCPTNTTVSGTTVLFVGELTDMGGDSTTSVWFEYGKTTAYGEKTGERVLTEPGFYCITVTGLSPGTTYHYRAVAKNEAGTAYGENRSFTTTSGPTVDIKANGSDGPITVAYNSSVNLSWISSNVDSCTASGGWSGIKGTSGSQKVENLTSSRTYTLTCSGPAGSASDSVTVNVEGRPSDDFSVYKTARNLSQGTGFAKSINANPREVIVFGIGIRAGNQPLYNVIVKDTLPTGLIYQGDLRVDNVLTTGDIFAGLNIGNLSAGEEKTVTFRANVAGAENFSFGQTELTNSVLVSTDQVSRSDSAKVIVTRTTKAAPPTEIPTALTNNLFIDSFLLPLMLALSGIFLFKARIIKIEEWLDARKKEYRAYKSRKILQLKVSKIRAREFLAKIV